MITELGYATLIITFLLTLFGIFAVIWGMVKNKEAWIDSSRASLMLVFPLLTLTIFYLGILLVDHHYEVQYVYQLSGDTLPIYLRIAAIWGGQAGSLLFWSWTLSLFGFVFMRRNWNMDRVFMPWIILVYLFILSFFIALNMFYQNPFVRFWQLDNGEQLISLLKPAGSLLLRPSDGLGGNPMLHHPGMILHPPLLYLGYSALLVSFTFGVAALIIKRIDDRWIRVIRPWTILAWIFLLLGILVGTRWTYLVMGWGTNWTWDPVESTALMPWLLTTAFIHSILIQEKSRLYMRWNMILVVLDFLIVLYGMFLSRTGFLSSGHQYTESNIRFPFYIFMLIMFAASLYLIIVRWGYLKSDGLLYTYFSRESLFILNNLFLFALFAVIFVGITYPILAQVISGEQMIVGDVWFTKTTGPIFIMTFLAMSIAPATSWGYSTWKTVRKYLFIPFIVSAGITLCTAIFGVTNWLTLIGIWLILFSVSVIVFDFIGYYRSQLKQTGKNIFSTLYLLVRQNQRRYGAYIVHLSIAVIAMSVLATNQFLLETQQTLQINERYPFSAYEIQFTALERTESMAGRETISADLQLYKDGLLIEKITPKREYFKQINHSISMPGIYSTAKEDIYVVIADWEPILDDQVTFKMYRNALAIWMWIGGLGMVFGALICILPGKKRF
jgi:cytochrome c-type biogenesis protein CcmF